MQSGGLRSHDAGHMRGKKEKQGCYILYVGRQNSAGRDAEKQRRRNGMKVEKEVHLTYEFRSLSLYSFISLV